MFNLIVMSQRDFSSYTFSAIERCIALMNILKSKAIDDEKDEIIFSFSSCCIDDISMKEQFTLEYNIYSNKIFINCLLSTTSGLTLTDDLTTEILYDLFEKNNFIKMMLCGKKMIFIKNV